MTTTPHLNSEVMAMTMLIICILISKIAYECTGFPFETTFFYISLAIQLYKGCFRLQKNFIKQKQKISKNTNDKGDIKARQINQYNIGSITFKL